MHTHLRKSMAMAGIAGALIGGTSAYAASTGGSATTTPSTTAPPSGTAPSAGDCPGM